MAELRQKEFDLFVGKLSKLRAKDVMDADMIRVSSIEASALESIPRGTRRLRTKGKLQKGKGSG